MTTLNNQFEKIRQSHTVAMADRVNALKAAGRPVIGLQTGDPDFATPPASACRLWLRGNWPLFTGCNSPMFCIVGNHNP